MFQSEAVKSSQASSPSQYRHFSCGDLCRLVNLDDNSQFRRRENRYHTQTPGAGPRTLIRQVTHVCREFRPAATDESRSMNAENSAAPQQFHIRAAGLADLETIADFNRRLAWESERLQLDPLRVRDGVRRVLEGAAEAMYFVAVAESEIAGQLMLTREWSDWRNGLFFWVQSVYVAASHRQQGAFRQLLAYATDYVTGRPDGVGLRLYVEEHNTAAQETYARLRFQVTGYRVLELPIRHAPELALE